jgi:hypothetical protein
MSNKRNTKIKNFFLSVLSLSNLSKEIQERIFDYGIKYSDFDLLATLASRSDLDPDIDKLLSTVDSANVRVAWAKKPQRTAEELVNLVKKEKRVKVLSALASRTDSPEEILKAIALHGKGQALESLLLNNNVDLDIKKEAATRYGKLATDIKRVSTQQQIALSNDPFLANIIASNTSSLTLADAALNAAGNRANKDSINNFINLYSKYYTTISKKDYSSGDYQYLETITCALELTNETDKELIKTTKSLISMLMKEYDKSKSTYYFDRVESLLDRIDKIKENDSETISILDFAKSVSSSEEKLTLNKRLENETIDNSVYLALARNENISASELYDIVEKHNFGWYSYKSLALSLNMLPYDKAGALLLHFHYTDDALLEKTTDPHQVLLEATKLANSKGDFPFFVLQSKYFTSEIIKYLPVDVFIHDNIHQNITTSLVEYITTELGDNSQYWDTLASLSEEYEGPFLELINLVKHI